MKNAFIILGGLALVGVIVFFLNYNTGGIPHSTVAAGLKKSVNQKVEVIVFSTSYCGYCTQAKKLLDARGIKYTEKDAMLPDVRQEMNVCTDGARTVPQIMIGKNHIGGMLELRALDQSGDLAKMVSGKI
jgi:glutaredoxin 3